MKQLSTGTGLAVLGVSLAICSMVSTSPLGVRAEANPQAQTPPAQIPACSISNALPWLDPTPRMLSVCTGGVSFTGWQSFGASDINCDGALEYFDSQPTYVIYNAAWAQAADIAFTSRSSVSANGTSITLHPILSSTQSLANAFFAMTEPYNWSRVAFLKLRPLGWRDMDYDGDLDLVVQVEFQWSNGGDWQYTNCWFENTGYQKSAPLFGDLDNDGHVGSGDISILLLNFTD